jgi:hypothetical protein
MSQVLAEVEHMTRVVGEDDFTRIWIEEDRSGDSGNSLKLPVSLPHIPGLVYTTVGHKSVEGRRLI